MVRKRVGWDGEEAGSSPDEVPTMRAEGELAEVGGHELMTINDVDLSTYSSSVTL